MTALSQAENEVDKSVFHILAAAAHKVKRPLLLLPSLVVWPLKCAPRYSKQKPRETVQHLIFRANPPPPSHGQLTDDDFTLL